MAINFPNTPVPDQTFVDGNGVLWIYTGEMWRRKVTVTAPEFITVNTTISITADYSTVQAALDYLADKRIAPGITVTIEVTSVLASQPLATIDHPDSAQIFIQGNAEHLTYGTTTGGFKVEGGNILNLKNLIITGPGASGTGVQVLGPSKAILDGIGCSNLFIGVRVQGGQVWANKAAGQTYTPMLNNNYGLIVEQNGFFYAVDKYRSTGNSVYGVWARYGGVVDLSDGAAYVTSTGAFAALYAYGSGAYIDGQGAENLSHGGGAWDAHALWNAYIDIRGATYSTFFGAQGGVVQVT